MSDPAVGAAAHEAASARGFGVKRRLTARRVRRVIETPEFASFAARILRACARRVGDGDVEGLATLVALRSELDRAIVEAVHGLRDPRWAYSWAEIAGVLGTTRQAAHQRYGAPPVGRQCEEG